MVYSDKSMEMQKNTKIRPVGGEFFHMNRRPDEIPDRQTDRQKYGWADMTKLIVDFRNFGNAPKKKSRFVNCAQRKCVPKTKKSLLFARMAYVYLLFCSRESAGNRWDNTNCKEMLNRSIFLPIPVGRAVHGVSFAAARMLGLRVLNPTGGGGMDVCLLRISCVVSATG